MASNAELFAAADQAVRTIKTGNAEDTIQAFATALGRDADYRSLSAKDVRSITSKLIWANEAISRQVYRLGRTMIAMLNEAKAG
jgi:hypothetical protein